MLIAPVKAVIAVITTLLTKTSDPPRKPSRTEILNVSQRPRVCMISALELLSVSVILKACRVRVEDKGFRALRLGASVHILLFFFL